MINDLDDTVGRDTLAPPTPHSNLPPSPRFWPTVSSVGATMHVAGAICRNSQKEREMWPAPVSCASRYESRDNVTGQPLYPAPPTPPKTPSVLCRNLHVDYATFGNVLAQDTTQTTSAEPEPLSVENTLFSWI